MTNDEVWRWSLSIYLFIVGFVIWKVRDAVDPLAQRLDNLGKQLEGRAARIERHTAEIATEVSSIDLKMD
jgi:hypothetical protein